ncbi:DNA mismatch repair endonuclease MutL [Necropsobacter massiliensis]|uniref:DNA mismatch repair endonuclease MutL n=1 Tax=Necropsobacter massiliensis TaxID=1400001 RepID=UPI000595E55B|nr:DNA mismatch repair endonuclease MutL [Necropsobacter massiliensis]
MAIQILPPQLANQIAAGEVVERPASVVKELVENSLDAGATRIQIDIEQGGAGLIRVRDNGVGIAKQDIALALARHATSKIASIEDLEAILSLGFRGEALASISSVSRLTLTSRPREQAEAWQVYAQGRDMETTIQPASHPVGCTVEVANLFFNTPARRKFLRSDKTEFAHIDEVIRRIALAKPAIAFSLSHNGKSIRQYRSAADHAQKLKRLAAICGEDFVQQALQIDWKHDSLHLSGWVALPTFNRAQNDLNYCYVNGRMVRDKVINHAIRQAYADYPNHEQYPAFVLFIDINPHEVDVNVHPTKHEVRFHQARLIHDFICQGIGDALAAGQTDAAAPETTEHPHNVREPAGIWSSRHNQPNRAAAGQNMFGQSGDTTSPSTEKRTQFAPHFKRNVAATQPVNKTEQKLYRELLSDEHNVQTPVAPNTTHSPNTPLPNLSGVLHTLALIENQALLLQQDEQFYLLSLATLQQTKLQLTLRSENCPQQPLLIPLMFHLTNLQQQHWQQQKAYFQQFGFQFNDNLAQQRISLHSVPACLRRQNLQKCVIALLDSAIDDACHFLTALCQQIELPPISVLADAVSVLTETEQLINQQKEIRLQSLLTRIDWRIYLDKIS